MTLAGICLPYLLDTLELNFHHHKTKHQQPINNSIYLIRKLLYLFYNLMMAYMIVNRYSENMFSIKIIVVVLSMHFIVLNTNFRAIYPELFKKQIRWFAIIGLILGGSFGLITALPEVILAYLFSFIGGTLTYIALKQEPPKTQHRSPFHFLAGIICFLVLILAIPYLGKIH